MALTITVTLNDDGTYRVDPTNSPDVTAWCLRHRTAVSVHFSADLPEFMQAADAPHVVDATP